MSKLDEIKRLKDEIISTRDTLNMYTSPGKYNDMKFLKRSIQAKLKKLRQLDPTTKFK